MSDTTKLFRIEEVDFVELERLLPDLLERLQSAEAAIRQAAGTPSGDNKLCVQIRRVQTILMNVRWGYGPFVDSERIPADG